MSDPNDLEWRAITYADIIAILERVADSDPGGVDVLGRRLYEDVQNVISTLMEVNRV